LKGDTGIQGEKGETGSQGLKGDTGIQGEKGDTGVQGLKGDTGIQGEKGDTGVQGLKGDTGIQGEKGDTGVQGLKGDTGIQGDKGDTGAQGLKGDTGIQGEKGDTGTKGDRGETGSAAFAVGDGTIIINGTGTAASPYEIKSVTTNALTIDGTKLKSTVNTKESTVDLQAVVNEVTTVANTSSVNNISTTVNGKTGLAVKLINSNVLGITGDGKLKSTINGIESNEIPMLDGATNGLTKGTTSNAAELGGTLVRQTVIQTDAVNTLAIKGLPTGVTTDSQMVVGTDGVLKTIAASTAMAIITRSSDYTATDRDETILVDANLQEVTITLPAAVQGKKYYIKKIDESDRAVKIKGSGTQKIEGLAIISGSLPYQGWLLQFDGTNWFIISRI